MIRTIISKEIIESLLGPKFLITLGISMVLVLVSMVHGYQLYETEQDWYAQAQRQNMQRLENLGSYTRVLEEGSKSLREPDLMSVYVRGVDSAVGRSAMVGSDAGMVIRDSRIGLNPVFAVFGELDLAFIVKYILSLFALLFSYNAISGERETGTLKMVFSNSMRRSSYLLGKMIGGLVPLLLTLIIPFLIGQLLLMTVFNASFGAGNWLRIGAILLTFCLYLSVFYAVGLLMSSLARVSMISFLFSLFFWVLAVVLVPKLAVEVAGYIHPAPSIDEVEVQRTLLQQEHYRRVKSIIYDRVMDALDTDGFVNTGPIRRQANAQVQAELADREKQLIDDYTRRQMRLLAAAETYARVSPTSVATFAVNRLARTDVGLRERFIKALHTYRQQFVSYTDGKIARFPEKTRSGIGVSVSVDVDNDTGQQTSSASVSVPDQDIEISDMPVFRLEEEPVETTLSAVLVDLAILVFEILLVFLLATVFFTRYDVR